MRPDEFPQLSTHSTQIPRTEQIIPKVRADTNIPQTMAPLITGRNSPPQISEAVHKRTAKIPSIAESVISPTRSPAISDLNTKISSARSPAICDLNANTTSPRPKLPERNYYTKVYQLSSSNIPGRQAHPAEPATELTAILTGIQQLLQPLIGLITQFSQFTQTYLAQYGQR